MREVIFYGLFILASCLRATAQTASLPTVILDSMIFEVKRGRQCELVIKSQSNELQKQGLELAHTATALKLSQSESKTLQGLLENSKESNQLQVRQHSLEIDGLKRKNRKKNVIIIILIGVFVAKEALD